ncbi:MAG: 5'-nucleotidase C-terminal domain-containing protein [Ferruginibacter sp.]
MGRIGDIILTFTCIIFFSLSCKTAYQPQSYSYVDYRVTKKGNQNPLMDQLLKSYSDSVNKSMNDVVAMAGSELVKSQPEGTLGNILVDAMLTKAIQSYKIHIDAAFINYGGIRLNTIPAGDITRGKFFELSPFDNIIVLLKLNGKLLLKFLNHISNKGGWPTAGMQWQIKSNRAINILINGKPLDENATYTIAVPDYVANGGDDCTMLEQLAPMKNGYLLRDAIIEYFTDINKQGKKITATLEKRISNAE